MNKYQIFCDMDGVLADFDRKKLEVFGKLDVADSHMWPIIHKDYPFWFYDLEPMKDMEVLRKFLHPHKPIVLTATPNPKWNLKRIRDVTYQKQEWVRWKVDGGWATIVCLRSQKKDWATPESILIDDHGGNVKAFVKAGGIGILHTSAQQTIKQLTEIFGEKN